MDYTNFSSHALDRWRLLCRFSLSFSFSFYLVKNGWRWCGCVWLCGIPFFFFWCFLQLLWWDCGGWFLMVVSSISELGSRRMVWWPVIMNGRVCSLGGVKARMFNFYFYLSTLAWGGWIIQKRSESGKRGRQKNCFLPIFVGIFYKVIRDLGKREGESESVCPFLFLLFPLRKSLYVFRKISSKFSKFHI